MNSISQRVKDINPSATLSLTSKVAEMNKRGENIISFNLGEPDFNTPQNIIEQGIKALYEGITKYTPTEGANFLREAISKKLLNENGIEYNSNSIIVTNGAKQALFNALMAVCDKGDEVIVLTPCWVSYVEMIKLAGGVPILVSMSEKNDFSLDINKIKKALTNRTKAIIINSPNNPTGVVYEMGQLEKLGRLAVEKNILIISDEIYEKLIYQGKKHISVASLSDEIKDITITVNGVSKAYAMTGWRIGYAAGPYDVIRAMVRFQSHATSGANSPAQFASVEALTNSKEYADFMKDEFEKRKKEMINRINKMGGITCIVPKGAFYAFPNVKYYLGKKYKKKVIRNSGDLCEFLLTEGKIALVPGEAFFCPDNVRISYSNSLENISKGMDRMENALKMLV